MLIRALLLAAVAVLAGCGTLVPVSGLATAPATPGATPCSAPGQASSTDAFDESVTLTTVPSGLQYGDITVGCGPVVASGRTISIQYTGWLTSGKQFDTSRTSGNGPYSFVYGAGQVITGLEDGIRGMHAGGKRRLVIPPSLAFGSAGRPPVIPANATLVFDVEVLSVS